MCLLRVCDFAKKTFDCPINPWSYLPITYQYYILWLHWFYSSYLLDILSLLLYISIYQHPTSVYLNCHFTPLKCEWCFQYQQLSQKKNCAFHTRKHLSGAYYKQEVYLSIKSWHRVIVIEKIYHQFHWNLPFKLSRQF